MWRSTVFPEQRTNVPGAFPRSNGEKIVKNRGGEGKVAIVILYHAINETAQRGKFGKEEKGKNGKRGNYISKVKKILFYLIPG